jgi:hypothetical protein
MIGTIQNQKKIKKEMMMTIIVNGGAGDDVMNYMPSDFNGQAFEINGGSGDDVITIGNPASESLASTEDPIAANEHGRIWGDPHFEGGDGGKYDVQGEAGKTYSLLTDEGLDLRGRFDAWSAGVTVVGKTGLTLTGEDGQTSEIAFNKDGTATIDGEVMEEGKTYDLADGGTTVLEGNELTVKTAEGYTIKQSTQGSGDRAYINIDVTTGENGVGSGQLPGGLLGQSFDADSEARVGSGNQGESAIDGSVEDYEVDALFMSNGHVNGGSGDDILNLFTYGNYIIDMGSGDDELNVDFEEGVTDAKAIVNGGSGDDTVMLAGFEEDYNKTEEDGYTVYTDASGNRISVGDDVEEVIFKSED